MQREIFVGSSSEGLQEAQRVASILSTDPEVVPVSWTEVFQPGYLAFEALETVLRRCCGAVFVAGPDDQSTIRGRTVRLPRANIMLEFGLMAGRLGRYNIALWQYDSVELPSDLKGLTVISPDPSNLAATAEAAATAAAEKLRTWASKLSATTDGIPRTEIYHGYSGAWDFEMNLRTWRGITIVAPGYVTVKGTLSLIMLADGQGGRGSTHGRLYFRLPFSETETYQGEYHTVHEIRNATCLRDGSMALTTEAFAIQKITATGTPPPQLADLECSPEPWTAKWTLAPVEGLPELRGSVESEGGISTAGEVHLERSSDIL